MSELLNSNINNLDDVCPICLDYLPNSHIILECNHKICKECIILLINYNTKTCPICRSALSNIMIESSIPSNELPVSSELVNLPPPPQVPSYNQQLVLLRDTTYISTQPIPSNQIINIQNTGEQNIRNRNIYSENEHYERNNQNHQNTQWILKCIFTIIMVLLIWIISFY